MYFPSSIILLIFFFFGTMAQCEPWPPTSTSPTLICSHLSITPHIRSPEILQHIIQSKSTHLSAFVHLCPHDFLWHTLIMLLILPEHVKLRVGSCNYLKSSRWLASNIGSLILSLCCVGLQIDLWALFVLPMYCLMHNQYFSTWNIYMLELNSCIHRSNRVYSDRLTRP